MKKMPLVVLLIVLVGAAAFYWFFLQPRPAERAEPAGAEPVAPSAAQDPSPPAAAGERAAGLHMTLETSMGTINCKLFESEAPVTVRKIVGLATGRITYLDPSTNQPVVGKRFYDGLVFHRVIPNFMIQGGDPLGTGSGGPRGPGFPFEDEFHPRLKFDVPGRLAMANSGPGTNGSQFFITEVETPHLNNRHTIFGDCSNLSVVRAIARVPRDANNRPNTPVRIQRVVVERVGPKPENAPEG